MSNSVNNARQEAMLELAARIARDSNLQPAYFVARHVQALQNLNRNLKEGAERHD